ncbi:prophage tail fiber N-terminal domain-containing protein, partial [Escherichia coli]|uniref:prophage tail fiber N-terminal domain-containing protein n=1 Tax=Escherichia coli TaxID=562 RepID=UPI0014824BA2
MRAGRFLRLFCGGNKEVRSTGVLNDGTGKTVENCTIQMKPRQTNTTGSVLCL